MFCKLCPSGNGIAGIGKFGRGKHYKKESLSDIFIIERIKVIVDNKVIKLIILTAIICSTFISYNK